MKPEEFRKRLDRLQGVLRRGLAFYTVWKRLRLHDPSEVSWSLEEANEVAGRYRGFFTPVALALRDMALMEFAKLFDTDRRTASLTNLLAAAQQEPSLIPNASAGDVDKVSAQLRRSKRILTGLKRKRDQEMAHIDAEPLPVDPILSADFDKLVDDVKSAFSFLWAHSGRDVSWDEPTTDWHTTEMLRALVEETRQSKRSISRSIQQSRLD